MIKFKVLLVLTFAVVISSCNQQPQEVAKETVMEVGEHMENRVEATSFHSFSEKLEDIRLEIIELGETSENVDNLDDALKFFERYIIVIYKWKTLKYRILSPPNTPEATKAEIQEFENNELNPAIFKCQEVINKYRGEEKFQKLDKKLRDKYGEGI